MIALQLAEKQKFENLKYKKKTLIDLADLADDWVAINWKTKVWKFKLQKKLSQIKWNLQKKSAKSAQSARAYF